MILLDLVKKIFIIYSLSNIEVVKLPDFTIELLKFISINK